MTARGRHAYDAVMVAWAPHAVTLEQSIGPVASHIFARDMAALAETFRDIADRSNRSAGHCDGMSFPDSKGAENEP